MARKSILAAVTLAAYAAFGALLAFHLHGRAVVSPAVLISIATIGLLGTLLLLVQVLASIRRGPPPSPPGPAGAARCSGSLAESVRQAASQRDAAGGRGYSRPLARLAPAVALAGMAAALASGLLNFAFRVEGRWIQYAGSGKDLDLRPTYSELSLGAFADPAELKYGVLVGEVRPAQHDRLADVEVIDASGGRVGGGTLAPGSSLRIHDLALYEWAVGPGARVTIVQKDRGRLFEQPVPMWPGSAAGEYAVSIAAEDVQVELFALGWPSAGGEPALSARIRSGEKVLFEGPIKTGRVAAADDGYGLIVWELRPYVGLGLAHRTYRVLTLSSLSLTALGLLAWAVLRARPFWYTEEADGALSVQPASALAVFEARRS
jgi:hypothetical protein